MLHRYVAVLLQSIVHEYRTTVYYCGVHQEDQPRRSEGYLATCTPVVETLDYCSHRNVIRNELFCCHCSDERTRAGCMKGGSRAVKEHKWFQGMDWEAVYNGQVRLFLAHYSTTIHMTSHTKS